MKKYSKEHDNILFKYRKLWEGYKRNGTARELNAPAKRELLSVLQEHHSMREDINCEYCVRHMLVTLYTSWDKQQDDKKKEYRERKKKRAAKKAVSKRPRK